MTSGAVEIFLPVGADGFELCRPATSFDSEALQSQIRTDARTPPWQAPRFQIVREDQGRPLAKSDSPWLGSFALVFRESAASGLGGIPRDFGELLPAPSTAANLQILRAPILEGALNVDASSIARFASGRVMHISKYVFHKEVVAGVPCFCVPELRVSPTFLSDDFVAAWRAAGLRGLEFKSLWRSEATE